VSTVGVAVLLGIVVFLLLKFKIVRPVGAAVCIVFGLVLGATPLGDQVSAALSGMGNWVATQFQTL
jgi:hypothetical protein